MICYSSGGVDSPCDCQWICGKTTSTRYMMSTSRENVPVRNIGKVSNGMKKHRVGLKTFYLMFVSKIEFQADRKKRAVDDGIPCCAVSWHLSTTLRTCLFDIKMMINMMENYSGWRCGKADSCHRRCFWNIKAANLHVKEPCTIAKTDVSPPLCYYYA